MSEEVESKEETPTLYQKWFGRSKVTEVEVILFGFALVLGNRNFAWNLALPYGYAAMATNTLFVGSAFFCLCLCMGEMTSALPFSGGIFGFVRATTGPYYGFVVACYEVIFCLAYQIVILKFCILVPIVAGYVDETYTPTLIYIIYGFNLFLNLLGGKPYWIVIALAGFTTFFLLMSFLVGTLIDVNKSNINFDIYCKTDIPVTLESLMKERPLASSQFQGLQYLPLLSQLTKEPRKTIPRAMMVCASEFLTFSFFISLAACSTFPGQMILQLFPMPLTFGYEHIFKTDMAHAVWLHFPGLYAPSLAFMYISGRQLFMIAKSGFLPSIFTYTTPQTGTPIVSLFVTTIVGAGACLLTYYYPDYYDILIDFTILSSHFVFINAFVAYLFFLYKFSSMPRSFKNPLGVVGAFYGIGNNLFGIISVLMYPYNTWVFFSFYILLGFFGFITLFYWGYMARNQIFSDEEKNLMFKAYLINANRDKRVRMLRNNRVSAATNGSKSAATANKKSAIQAGDSSNIPETVCDDTSSPPRIAHSYTVVRPAEETKKSEKLHTKSLSEKVMNFVNEKIHHGITPEALHDYQQLAVISAGGVIEATEEQELEERLGLNDVEQSNVN